MKTLGSYVSNNFFLCNPNKKQHLEEPHVRFSFAIWFHASVADITFSVTYKQRSILLLSGLFKHHSSPETDTEPDRLIIQTHLYLNSLLLGKSIAVMKTQQTLLYSNLTCSSF